LILNSFNKSKNVNWNSLTVGIITLVIILIFNYLFKIFPLFYKEFYWDAFFQLIRIAHDYLFGLLPIATIYLLIPTYFTYFLYNNCNSLKSFGLALVKAFLWIINLFYILWGFNYTQPSIYTQLDIERVVLDSAYIKKEFLIQHELLSKLAEKPYAIIENSKIEKMIRLEQESLIGSWDVKTYGKVRIRRLPAGSLLSIRTSGIYIPHALEGHYDGGLFYKQHPFTMAHEMAHGYGFTDESVCNFIAYLTCKETGADEIVYSAELAYWRYLAKYYRYYFPDEWDAIYSNLAPQLKDDLVKIREHIEKYKDLLPEMRDIIYDKYLKTHGVSAGIKSYDEMIQLIAAYKKHQEAGEKQNINLH